MLHHIATALTAVRWPHLGYPRRELTGKDSRSCEALSIGQGQTFYADYAWKGRRANADSFVKAMTGGDMNVRDIASPLINHIPLATSEDLRWGRLWPVLVSVRGVQVIASICDGGLGSA